MATATAMKSKVYTISVPPELAQKAEALAQRDSRSTSELFREAFRTHSAQQARRTLDELGEYAAHRIPKRYTEVDVSRLVKEVRAEKPHRRRVRSRG